MLEKVIADQLTYILEDGNLLNDSQAGFRQTADQSCILTCNQ